MKKQAQDPLKNKSLDFSIRIVNLYRLLIKRHREFVISKQILKSGTSIGANIHEAIGSVSYADFSNKLSVAYKEASETKYWLELLFKTHYISSSIFQSMNEDCDELSKMLYQSIKTTRNKS